MLFPSGASDGGTFCEDSLHDAGDGSRSGDSPDGTSGGNGFRDVLETLELVLPMEMVVAPVVLMVVLQLGMPFPVETVVVVLMVVLSVEKVSVPLVAFRVCFAWWRRRWS